MPLEATQRIAGRISSSGFRTGADGTTFICASWSSEGLGASAAPRGPESCGPLSVLDVGRAERQIVKDRAFRPVVAPAVADQPLERLRHRLHLGDPRLKIAGMRL